MKAFLVAGNFWRSCFTSLLAGSDGSSESSLYIHVHIIEMCLANSTFNTIPETTHQFSPRLNSFALSCGIKFIAFSCHN